MARANLRGLIGNLGDTETDSSPSLSVADDPPVTVEQLPEPPASAPAPKGTTVLAGARQSDSTTDLESEPQVARSPRFSDLARKETRLRVDQQDALTEHARRLNRAKGPGGQRITDNTLIRVAVDLLLSKAENLAGADEHALRRSVGVRGTE